MKIFKKDVWIEYAVRVYDQTSDAEIDVCCLCGNSGILNTLNNIKWDNKKCGIKAYCICPYGRLSRKKHIKNKWGMSSIIKKEIPDN